MSSAKLGREYIRKGWAPIPIPYRSKKPALEEWQNLRIDEDTVDRYFDGTRQNIGVLLGEPSGWLVDIDLDTPEAILLAKTYLPATTMFGRKGAPQSHYLFVTTGPIKTRKYPAERPGPDGKVGNVVELRSTGAQTIFPGSIHESGEPIEWVPDCSAPLDIAPKDLQTTVGKVAASALLAREWLEIEGKRDECAMALSGALLRAGWYKEAVRLFMKRVVNIANDEEAGSRVRTVTDTLRKLSTGEPVTGWPKLAELLGDRVVKKLRDWLEIKGSERSSSRCRKKSGNRLNDTYEDADLLQLASQYADADPTPFFDVLAKVPLWKYSRERANLAKALKMSVVHFDKEVEKRRPRNETNDAPLQGTAVSFPEPDPWSEKVDGAELLDELADTFTRYLKLPQHGDVALALWTMFAHCHDAFYVSPIMCVRAPAPNCGKSTVLDILQHLTPRPKPVSNTTMAAIYRVIAQYEPTLLLDEAETWLRPGNKDDSIRGILNSGHLRALAYVDRCVGDNMEVRSFSTWCAKAIALIGSLPPTLHSRSIVLSMERKGPDDNVEDFDQVETPTELGQLRRKIERWAADNLDTLRHAKPSLPPSMQNRARDNWKPLCAIADQVGGQWPEYARSAAVAHQTESDNEGARINLLSDMRDIFMERQRDGIEHWNKIHSDTLVDKLAEREERAWGDWKHGKPITKQAVAALLKGFDIKPKDQRIGVVVKKGYSFEACQKAFTLYLSTNTPPT